MQIQAITAVAGLVDDCGAQRVDVEFCRLLWILVFRCTWLSFNDMRHLLA